MGVRGKLFRRGGGGGRLLCPEKSCKKLLVLQAGMPQVAEDKGCNTKRFIPQKSVSQNTNSLRNSETALAPTKPKTEFLKRTFGYSGAILWNDFPQLRT